MAMAVVTGAVVMLAGPSPAHASESHTIDGSTYSTGGKFYLSATWRYKDGASNVRLLFTRLPRYSSGAVDGLRWRFYFGSSDGYSSKYLIDDEDSSVSTKYMSDGTAFKNSFARVTTCKDDCSHYFAGYEAY
ncbi:hypothetical protein [Actinoplanes sp. NPDC051851]|uniref:hypothetical protein n=1 Tax=Actinoplanes sp. NPDC051851 TaxID=3154753 RepID=UPI003426B773